MALSPKEIRWPGFCGVSHRLRFYPVVRGIFPRRLFSGTPPWWVDSRSLGEPACVGDWGVFLPPPSAAIFCKKALKNLRYLSSIGLKTALSCALTNEGNHS